MERETSELGKEKNSVKPEKVLKTENFFAGLYQRSRKYLQPKYAVPLTLIMVSLACSVADDLVSTDRINEDIYQPTATWVAESIPTSAVTDLPVKPSETVVPPLPTGFPPIPSEGEVEIVGAKGNIFTAVSSMNQSKDRLGNERDREWIASFVDKAVELGATHIRLETPYNDSERGSANDYSAVWVEEIRRKGLNVFHAHMFLEFEGIYEYQGNPERDKDYIGMMQNYIREYPQFFEAGDKFMPFIEPAERGVMGMNCGEGCMFDSVDEYNRFLVEATLAARETISQLPDGKGNDIEVICCGDNGFAYWGDGNEYWLNEIKKRGFGFIYPETVNAIGHVALHHYPAEEASWSEDLREFREIWPDAFLYVVEFGTIRGGDTESFINDARVAFLEYDVKGASYWQMGPSGHESLIDENFNNAPHFDEVQELFTDINEK